MGGALRYVVYMGTTVWDRLGIHITRFWGGDARGTCYQINIKGCYVQLTEDQYFEMLFRLLRGDKD